MTPLVVLGVFFLSSFFTVFALKINQTIFFTKQIKLGTSKVTKILIFITILLFILNLFSMAIGHIKYSSLLAGSLSAGLRVITTSLHPLVPLESRLLYTLLPVMLFFPRIKISLRRIIMVGIIFLAILCQTKSAAIYFPICGVTYILLFEKLEKFKKIWLIFSLLAFSLYLLLFIRLQSFNSNPGNVYFSPKIPKLELVEISKKEKNQDEASCRLRGGAPEGVKDSTYEYLLYRAFNVSSKVIRLFICLRENNWRPNFRGHQSMRLIGQYIPYYRYAYHEYSGRGTSANSAVSNLVADSYFNLGYLGVVLGGIFVALVYFVFVQLSIDSEAAPLIWLVRLNFMFTALQASILSCLVTLAPLILIFILESYFIKTKKEA